MRDTSSRRRNPTPSDATRWCRRSILANPAVLEVRDLHSFYGNAHVVCGASLTVGAGEVVALLGRNGMGKTTLIRSIMGLQPPQVRAGDIRWRGETLIGLRPHAVAARHIAIVPQGRRLFGSLTVLEHMTMLKSRRAFAGWTVERLFALFPRRAERRTPPGARPRGGGRQMLAIARALMIDPELILMDEPSEGLAPIMVQHLEDIVADLKKDGLSILLVEQNLYTALAVADRVYILETGKVVHEAKASAIARDPHSLGKYLGVN